VAVFGAFFPFCFFFGFGAYDEFILFFVGLVLMTVISFSRQNDHD
jgi:hypothetical protein